MPATQTIRGRPEVIPSDARWKLRECYLAHYGQWGPSVLRCWAIREGLGTWSTGAIARVIEDLKPPPAEDRQPPRKYEIVAPMVGTFYDSAPGATEPYISIGDVVEEETVVCIIEAMKIMNEVKAEARGKVVEILVGNGVAVEFGQALFTVEFQGNG